MLPREFLLTFKATTEKYWRERTVNAQVSGFQFQQGTRWNPGLSDAAIAEYENSVSIRFPTDLKSLLREMNGTDLATLNVYGSCGEPHRESVGVYSYPKDLEFIKRRIDDVLFNRRAITEDLAAQGFELPAESSLVPFYEHRYVVCTSDLNRSVVLSIATDVVGTDSIVYGDSLREYLEREFLKEAL
jgi:hypothetical protein